MRELTETELADLYAGICPHCKGSALEPGPRGGASQNFYCRACCAGYNRLAPEYTDRLAAQVPAFAQLIHEPKPPQ